MYSEERIAGAHTEFGVMSVYAVEILLLAGLGVGAWLDRQSLRIAPKYRIPVSLGVIAVIAAILGTAFADRSFFSLMMTVHLGFAFLLFMGLLLEHVKIKPILLAFVGGLIMPMILGVMQIVGGSSPASSFLGLASRDALQLGDAIFTMNDARILRAYGSFPHPNVFGGFLGVGLFAWWSGLDQIRKAKMRWSNIQFLFVKAMGTAIVILGLLLTGSRSAFLGVLVGLALVTMVKTTRSMKTARPLVLILSAIAVFGSLIGSFLFTDFVSGIRGGGANEERSLTERVALYEDYLPFFAVTNPIVGHGMGSYVLSFSDYKPGKDAFDYQPIHNVPLLILAELGFLGFLIILAWIANIDTLNFSRFPKRDALAAFGMGNVILMIMFFDHYLWSSWAGLSLVAFVMGMTVRMGEE